MHYPFGRLELFKLIKPFVGHLDYTEVGLHSGAVCVSLTAGVGYTVEDSGLPYAGDSDNSAFQCHVS